MRNQTCQHIRIGRATGVILNAILWAAGIALGAGPYREPAPERPVVERPAPAVQPEPAPQNQGGQAQPSNPAPLLPGPGVESDTSPRNNTPAAPPTDEHGNGRGGHPQNGNPATPPNYVDPGWPYTFDEDPYWYDNNNGAVSQATDTPNNAPAPVPNAVVNPPVPLAAPVPAGPSPAAVAAQAANAVDKSPEMIAANKEVGDAQRAYDNERARVLKSLGDKPEYQQLLAKKHAAAKDVATAKLTGQPQPVVTDAASEKLDASDEVTKMREQAVTADADAAAAKKRLIQAVADRDMLRAKLLQQVGQR